MTNCKRLPACVWGGIAPEMGRELERPGEGRTSPRQFEGLKAGLTAAREGLRDRGLGQACWSSVWRGSCVKAERQVGGWCFMILNSGLLVIT